VESLLVFITANVCCVMYVVPVNVLVLGFSSVIF
jgi:hypothetical protein